MAVASSLATTLSLLPLRHASPKPSSSSLSFALLFPSLSLRASPRFYATAADSDAYEPQDDLDADDDDEQEEDDGFAVPPAGDFDAIGFDGDGIEDDEDDYEEGDEATQAESMEIDIKPQVTTDRPPRESSSSRKGGKLLFGADSYPYKRPLTRLCSSLKDSPSTFPDKLILKNNSGENLSGILQDAGSNELVILCHGFRSSKESKTISHLGDALASKGISSFRFDFSGNGESEGNFEYGNYYKEVDDLRTVVQYFKEQNRNVTAILGHSKGGSVVILYAMKYRDVKSVVNLAGRFDLKGGIKERLGEDYMERVRRDGFLEVKDKFGKGYQVTEASLMERIGIDMRAACLSLDQNCRVLTIHGSKDSTVPPSDATEFSKAIKNHRLEIIEGADHRFSGHLYDMSDIVVEFVRLGLKGTNISY